MSMDAQPSGVADTHLAGGSSFAPGSLVLGDRFRVERLLGLETEDCGQGSAAEALRRIERCQ